MSHRIIRWEKSKGRKGNDEIFVHVEVNDGTEIYHKAEWLLPSDVARVIKNEKAIDTIATEIHDRAVLDRPAHKARTAAAEQHRLARIPLEVERTKHQTAKLEIKRLEKLEKLNTQKLEK